MATQEKTNQKIVATNPNARRNFHIEEVVEAGLVLQGTEVKSLRNQSPNLKDAYVEVRSNGKKIEAWLQNTHIAPYSHGNIWNHEPERNRKLLLNRNQLSRLYGAVTRKGFTIVPTKIYFKSGIAKIEIGLGKGKKRHDKRETEKKRSADREMAVARKQKR